MRKILVTLFVPLLLSAQINTGIAPGGSTTTPVPDYGGMVGANSVPGGTGTLTDAYGSSTVPANGVRISAGAKIWIRPMQGFETQLASAILEQQVPVTLVGQRMQADFALNGHAQEEVKGTVAQGLAAKLGVSVGPKPQTAEARVTMRDIKTGAIVFAFSPRKEVVAKGEQASAAAIAHHLKMVILNQHP